MADGNINKAKSEKRWTEAQQNAIYDEGGTILVSAAAGSGKTAVLVERAVHLMTRSEEPIDADKILIVTFTRAAAEELRGRIGARLAEMMLDSHDDMHLRRQRLLLGRADISTIDAFCMKLLQRYFAQLDIPPDFGVADEATVATLRRAAAEKTMEEMYKDEDFCEFASMYGRARTDDAAFNAVLSTYDYARSLPDFDRALDAICSEYESEKPLEETLWGKTLLNNALVAIQSAIKLNKSAQCIVLAEQELAKYSDALASDGAFLMRMRELLKETRWDDALTYAQDFKFVPFAAVRNYTGDKKQTVVKLRDGVKKIVADIVKNTLICTGKEYEDDRARTLPMMRALCRGAKMFSQLFYSAKIEENVLEYSDFEHLTLRLLCKEDGERSDFSFAVAQQFDAVMVDEYQDTNAIQEKIYTCLANKSLSNLFFVGDVKQSIYRFRLASPEIFIEKREAFYPYKQQTQHPATIILGHNFRSATNVINQINDVFACVMSKELGDVEYTHEEALFSGTADEFDGGALEIKIAEPGADGEQKGDASVVAKTIFDMVHSGYKVRGKNGTLRSCNWDDFCILLRTRTNFTKYVNALTALGVPCVADSSESWLQSTEVTLVVSLLRVIDNPGIDIQLAAVLMSPLFNMSADDLVKLRTGARNERLYTCVLKSDDSKAVLFCNTLKMLRSLAVNVSVGELCAKILTGTNYFLTVGAQQNGMVRRENLRRFLNYANGMQNANGLAGFLRCIDGALESNAQFGASGALPTGSVSVMTIHRSKGLEFPVCILADCSRMFNKRDSSNALLFHPVLGAGIKLKAQEGSGIFSTAPHAAIAYVQNKEMKSEEMRILYVALTRARDKLIITMPVKDPIAFLEGIAAELMGTGGVDAYTLGRKNRFTDWLCTVALLHPGCGTLRKIAGGATLPLLEASGSFTAEVLTGDDVEQEPQQTEYMPTSMADEELAKRLLQGFEKSARRDMVKSSMPVKLGVSAISHSGEEQILKRPSFMYKDGLTAAESGTAQHAFLQFANFASARQDINKEVQRLVEEKFIDAEIAKKLPKESMEHFLHTQVAQRMESADKLLREYDFMSSVSAQLVLEDVPDEHANTAIIVQGIADVVCVKDGKAEIIDYKSDKNKTAEQFIKAYRKQLILYKNAIEKQLNVPVVKCTIYSLHGKAEIDVPMD